ncbi:MAG: TRAP transporter large permease subunit [Negativicutes bacterium]|nr:TRAP transporter large permease subunit [Negativicutes bacterium]
MKATSRATDEAARIGTDDSLFNRVRTYVDRFFEIIVGIAILAELTVMFGNVVSRFFFHTSLNGIEEIGELSLVIIAFIGGAIAYPRGDHVAVEIMYKMLPQRCHTAIQAAAAWILTGISFIGAVLSVRIVFITTLANKTAILQISQAWYTLPMIAGLLLLTFYGLLRVWSYPRRTTLITGTVVLAVFVLLFFTQPLWAGLGGGPGGLILTLAAVVFFLFLGIPIGFVLAAGAMLYLFVTGTVAATAVPIGMQNSMMNFVLLAIPFFVMAGYVMTDGGLSRRLINFVMSLVGRVRGGLYHVIIVVTYIVSGLSGSKVADVTAVGTTMNETLRKEGYDPGETAAVLASAAVMGETVPPCINMLVLGSITTLSIGTLFVAGLLPAVVMAVVLMMLIFIRARMVNMPVSAGVPLKEVGRRALIAIPALFAPVLLVGGIVAGIGTPTEISTSAVVYSIILGLFIYRELTLRAIWKMVVETAAKAGMVLFIVSTASAFSWSLTVAQVPHEIAKLLIAVAGSSPTVFMLLSIFVLIVMGAILEGLPAILIFAPLLLPIAPAFGIHPVQFGLVLVISMGLGNFLPPIGVGAYVCVAVSKTTLEEMMRHMLPYLVALLVGIIIVALVPWFSLVLPRAFHLI